MVVIMSLYHNDSIGFVTQAVESILNQTFADFDFYIQYDGIIDAEVESFLMNLSDERIKIYKRAENKGLAQSLNDLLNIVMPLGYEYIARMDADDISEVNRFEKLLEYFKNHLELDFLGIWTIEITSSGDEYFKLAA